MRDPNRLFKFYDTIYDFHKKNPNLRMMQLLNNFFSWYYSKYKNDGFYLEDDKFIERFNEFKTEMSNHD